MRTIIAVFSALACVTAAFACSVEVGEPMDSSAFDEFGNIQLEGRSRGSTSSSSDGSTSSCTDVAPDANYTCAQQASWGKCGEAFMAGFCNATCGRCGSTSTSSSGGSTSSCTDVAPDANYTCAQQASWGKCGQTWMAGFCNSSCGRCGSAISCPDPEGTNAVMAALAVSAGTELQRWQPTQDFAISGDRIVLTSTGKAQCSDGKCWNTQALLDLQSDSASVVKIKGSSLNPPALRSRMVAKFQDQQACESQPANGSSGNCPVEAHKLTLQYSASGGCDTYFYYKATKTDGSALQYPGQLKNKLKWVDSTNPYVAFQNYGEIVAIDPTYGLNEAGSTSSGSCSAACAKVSATNQAGACCSCNGKTSAYVKSAFSAFVYLCQ